MNRRRLLAATAGIAAFMAVLAMLWLARPGAPSPPSTPPIPSPPGTESASPPPPDIRHSSSDIREAPAAATPPKTNARTRGSPLAAELNAPGFDAQHDVATLHSLLRQYQHLLRGRQGYPIGNDSDLAHVLTGHNPMKLVVLPADHPALAANGRLQDRWGTPYFIHPRGRGAFEIRSAGPDHKLFTADDLIQNPGGRATDLPDLPNTTEPPDE